MDPESLYEFMHYIAQIIVSGAYNNSWLAQMPAKLQPHLLIVGKWLSQALGY